MISRVLIAGGTGRLGTLVVNALAARGVEVRVMTRDPKRGAHLAGERIEVVTGDVRDPVGTMTAAENVDAVVSAVHGFAGPGGVSPTTVDRDGNTHLIKAAQAAGAELVLMSIVGAAPDSPFELFRMKYAAETSLAASAVPATVVRSTAFLELWIDLLANTAGRSNRPLVFGRGQNPINLVSVRDVAALVERGPRHIPRAALQAMVATVGRLRPELGRQARAALVMDQSDMTFPPGVNGTRARFPDLPCTSPAEALRNFHAADGRADRI